MKKFFFILLILSSVYLLAKDEVVLPKDETGKIVYKEVVQIDGVAKDELYSRALELFVKTYGSAKDVIQLQDKEQGRIVGKALFDIIVKDVFQKFSVGYVHYTIDVAVKDGRYKFEIFDFTHDWVPSDVKMTPGGNLENEDPKGMSKGFWRKIRDQVDAHTRLLIESLKAGMLKKVEAW